MVKNIKIYQEKDGYVPLLDWMDKLPVKVQDKCIEKIERLSVYGNQLRRPHCDYLEEGIWELRIQHQRVNYRILYFFHGNQVVILSHGLKKTKTVPKKEIKKAIERRDRYIQDPRSHTYKE